jgi:hypothetical protein
MGGLPLHSASSTNPVSRNFSISLRTAVRWGTGTGKVTVTGTSTSTGIVTGTGTSTVTGTGTGTGDSGNFSTNCPYTKSVYLLPTRKLYSTRKTRSSFERTAVSTNWFKQLSLYRNRTSTAV